MVKIFPYIPYFLIPFLLSLIATPLVRLLAIKYGFISYPRADRWHKRPTALLGGIGIYLATAISVLFLRCGIKEAFGLFAGGTFLFLVGLADDKLHLVPYTKLFMQIVAACIAVSLGAVVNFSIPGYWSIPLTIFWILLVTNAFNLLDNIDGLAAGVGVIASFMLFLTSLIFSQNPLGMFALIICGATLGFLPYNFNPAKIFMGDSGSMLIGFSLAVISISGTGRHLSNLVITMFTPVLILSVPLFDTIFVMLERKMQGRRIFEGGKDHTSHHLVTLGLSQRKTVIVLYTISILFGLIPILYTSRLNLFIISIIAFLAIVVLLFFGLFLFEVNVVTDGSKDAHKQSRHRNDFTVLNNILLYKRRVVEVLIDLSFVCIAYYGAYFLRFEGQAFAINAFLIRESIVWIILIKMATFFSFGLYRGVWRYISVSDFMNIFKVVSFGSIASVLFLTFVFRFQDYSRKVFFIDWLLLLFLIAGVRIIFRILGEFFSLAREKGKNVLIFGAGDTGEMVVREIKRNKSLNYNPVGFIDDDPFKLGTKIQGIPVLGTRQQIKVLVNELDIKELMIAVPSVDEKNVLDIVAICKEYGIEYRTIKGILDQ